MNLFDIFFQNSNHGKEKTKKTAENENIFCRAMEFLFFQFFPSSSLVDPPWAKFHMRFQSTRRSTFEDAETAPVACWNVESSCWFSRERPEGPAAPSQDEEVGAVVAVVDVVVVVAVIDIDDNIVASSSSPWSLPPPPRPNPEPTACILGRGKGGMCVALGCCCWWWCIFKLLLKRVHARASKLGGVSQQKKTPLEFFFFFFQCDFFSCFVFFPLEEKKANQTSLSLTKSSFCSLSQSLPSLSLSLPHSLCQS